MIVWTGEKDYQAAIGRPAMLVIVFWWIFMQSFAKSYQVESARAKARQLAVIPRDPLSDS
jgi:hypothetical protein